jgi:hypothetical protein
MEDTLKKSYFFNSSRKSRKKFSTAGLKRDFRGVIQN